MTTPPPGDSPEANDDIEFAFNFAGGQLKSPPLSAAELFDGGKIKPLKLLPRSQCWRSDCPKSPRSPKRMLTKAFLMSPPRHKKIDTHLLFSKAKKEEKLAGQKESKCALSATLTVTNMVSEPANLQQSSKETASLSSSSFSRSSSSSSSSWSRKWKFLFRSSSEGHATSKDDDYSFLRKSRKEEGMKKNLSFRSEDCVHSDSRGGGKKKGRVSAHEWHYKNNRAAAEERRRKTFLPYKKNLLGCMDLDPGVRQVSRWVGVEIKC